MCHAVTLLVPVPATAWFESESWPHLSWSPDEIDRASPALRARLGAGAFKLYHIGSSCSCGWFTPSDESRAPAAAHAESQRRWRRFANKGWSVAKTRRAFEQAEKAAARPSARVPGFADPLPEVIEKVAAHAGSCGIIAEWRGGKEDADSFDPTLESTCTTAQFRAAK